MIRGPSRRSRCRGQQDRRHPFESAPRGQKRGDASGGDEAAQIQGGVGTAGSANIGKRYAMFEAIHGTAPRMVEEGRAQYADPSSLIKAVAMMLNHIGLQEKSKNLDIALDICTVYEKKILITGRSTGATGEDFTNYLLDTLRAKNLEKIWKNYKK